MDNNGSSLTLAAVSFAVFAFWREMKASVEAS